MMKPIKAVSRDGVFVPESQPELAEGTAVEVIIQGPSVVADPAEREKILNRLGRAHALDSLPARTAWLQSGVARLYTEDITGYPKIDTLELVNPFVMP